MQTTCGTVAAPQFAQKEEEGKPAGSLTQELQTLKEKLSEELGAPVSIEKHGESGKITISFYSKEELENILQHLGGEEII